MMPTSADAAGAGSTRQPRRCARRSESKRPAAKREQGAHVPDIDFGAPNACADSLVLALGCAQYHVVREAFVVRRGKGIVTADAGFFASMLRHIAESAAVASDEEDREKMQRCSHLVIDLANTLGALPWRDGQEQSLSEPPAAVQCSLLFSRVVETALGSATPRDGAWDGGAHLAPKVMLAMARAFELGRRSPALRHEAMRYAELLLLPASQQELTAAVGFIVEFDLHELASESLCERLLDASRGDLVGALAANWPLRLAQASVEMCRARGRLRLALQIAESTGVLDAHFPSLREECARERVEKLMRKGLFEKAACAAAGSGAATQRMLMDALVEEGLADVAADVHEAHEFSCEPPAPHDAPASCGGRFLTLDPSLGPPMVVTDSRGLRALADAVRGASVIAMDTEWRPDGTPEPEGVSARPVAILQIAVSSAVFIVDMIALNAASPHRSELEETLATIFTVDDGHEGPPPVLLGFDMAADLRRLKRSVRSLHAVPRDSFVRTIDVQSLWRLVSAPTLLAAESARGMKKGASISLSSLSESLLGKRLSKAMQTSNWEKRPLSEKQVLYAGLDAFCLILIVDAMREKYGGKLDEA